MTAAALAVAPAAPSAPATAKYEFDATFQSKIAALACRDSAFARRCDGLVNPGYFDDFIEGVIVGMANDYYTKYRTVPASKSVWSELIKDAVKAKVVKREMAPDIVEKLKVLLGSSISDRDYVVDKVSEFARNQAVINAYYRGTDLIERGDLDGARKLLEDAFKVAANDEIAEINYWDRDQIAARAKYREDLAAGLIPKRGIATGIKKIDALLYHGGWGRQELSVIMGGAKKGKSMGLGFFAGRASLLGYNVLYLTLEVSTSIIADRSDACLSDTEMSQLGIASLDVGKKMLVYADREEKPGELRIVGFPTGSLTCRQIRRVIERYRADGVKFDLIVVDYADIMAPDVRTNDAIENSKQIWTGLRAIAQEEDLAMLTATQTNREGFKEATAKAEHAAEDFNKIRIADVVISINADDKERAAGEARLYIAANRNGAGEFTIGIKQDIAKMKFITSVTGIV